MHEKIKVHSGLLKKRAFYMVFIVKLDSVHTGT